MRRAPRIILKIACVLVALILILTTTAVLVLRSDWFRETVRQRIVTELERVTGGTVTLGSVAINWRLLRVEFRDLALRGTEPASSPPLLRAKSIAVELKIISLWRKDVDVQSVIVHEPHVNVVVAADGSTNLPAPKISRAPGLPGLEPLLDWKIASFALENGVMLFAEKKTELNLKGEHLHAQFSYDFTGPRYKGQISIEPMQVNTRAAMPFGANIYATLSLEKNRVEVSQAKIDMQRTYVEASGAIENLVAPKARFHFTAHAAVDQVARLLRIPLIRQGIANVTGSAEYTSGSAYSIVAKLKAGGLEFEQQPVRLAGVSVTSNVRLDPRGLSLDELSLDALGGRFTGKATLPAFERFTVEGTVDDFAIQKTLATLAPNLPARQRAEWSGVVSGPVRLEGRLQKNIVESILAKAELAILPAPGGIPIEGSVHANYDGHTGSLNLGQSQISTPGMQLTLSGTLGSRLEVGFTSTNLDELLPAINAFSNQPVQGLPVHLNNGKATFNGAIAGPLSSPQINGAVSMNGFTFQNIDFNSFAAQVSLNHASVQLLQGVLTRGAAQAQVAANCTLVDWEPEPSSAITADVSLRGAELSELLNVAGQKKIPARGALTASFHVGGTLGNPQGSAEVTILKGEAYGEPFDRVHSRLEYSPQAIKLTQTSLTAGSANVSAAAAFEPARAPDGTPDLRNGQLHFKLASNEFTVQQIKAVERAQPDFTGVTRFTVEGSAAVHSGAMPFVLTSLDADLSARNLQLNRRPVGDVKVSAKTQGGMLTAQVDSNFLNSNLQASGEWRLEPGYPGQANARFSRVSLGTVRQWLNPSGEPSALNLDGAMEGKVSVTGPALEPRQWKASIELSKLELFPLEQGKRPAVSQRIRVSNNGPIVLTLANSRMNIQSARFSGPSTDVKLTGSAVIEPKVSLDLRANGDVNLAVLENFDPDLEVEGMMTANASIRGSLERPQINGQLTVKRAAAHLTDITTGISGAEGVILFNGNQATIQNLTGRVGGGSVKLSGEVGLAGSELSYHVDASARDVRVRYPEGVSTSANADLNLRGTSQHSTLSGIITVLRTGFTPRTDFSSIIFQASQPVRTPSARVGPLSGMHFDVRIETAPDISFESAFAQDIEVEGSLRLQGSPYNPVLLGRINITQGEINFFGAKYTINQGSITFANPVRLEPVLNMDLETKVQGIDVILTVSGPVNKLNVTPRSDPPMQYSEVIALLATGAAPSTEPALAAQQNTPSQSFTQLGASALVGQVIANPVSGRLQRLFGVSNLKINPQFTGVENNPQARLTLEQRVTKNITFTYITNLTTSNQQIVRIEWALNQNWSVIAIRDENGLFGLDFQYKKRFH